MDQNIPVVYKVYVNIYNIICKMYYLEGFKMYKTIIKSPKANL